jgi:hypothetical protein
MSFNSGFIIGAVGTQIAAVIVCKIKDAREERRVNKGKK